MFSHPWLCHFDPKQILSKSIEAPLIPKLNSQDALDISHFFTIFTDETVNDSMVSEREKAFVDSNNGEFR